MIHIMDEEWELPGIGQAKIVIPKLYPLIKFRKLVPTELHINELAFKSLNDIHLHSVRYKVADINYPLIAISGVKNPHGKKYRMIDGRHRLLKQINSGKNKFLVYIFTIDDIKHYIEKL